MLTRRTLRIKVMQAIYAWEMDRSLPVLLIEKNQLLRSIDQAYEALLYHLHLLTRVADYVNIQADIKASKFLPTEADQKFSTSIAENRIIKAINEDQRFHRLLKKAKLHQRDHGDLVRHLFTALQKTAAYAKYAAEPTHDTLPDLDILAFLYKKVMLKDALFLDYMHDLFTNWGGDRQAVTFTVMQVLELYSENRLAAANKLYEIPEEEYEYAVELLRQTIEHDEEFTALIKPKLVNWDLDRLAIVDMILIKMALCELLHFPTIPVKVSINDYIEISKLYSTPRSKEFVNGMVDNLRKELREAGRIHKRGRGLVE